MIKLKNLLKGVLVFALVTCAGVFTGCSIFKDDKDTTPSTEVTTPDDNTGGDNSSGDNTPTKAFYVDQTYSALVKDSAEVQPVNVSATATTTGESTSNSRYLDFEKDVVSIKLKEGGVAYLIKDLKVYTGAYSVAENDGETIISLIVADIHDNVCRLTVKATEDEAVISESSNTDLFDNDKVTLKAVEDELFDNGLYIGLGSRTFSWGAGDYVYSDMIEGGAFTYKVSDTEIYSADGMENASKLQVERVGSNLIYISKYDRAGDDGETNLFFVEKKGEHDEEFVEEFGDLDYVIYSVEEEGGRRNRYYDRKATEEDVTLKITEKTTFNATKLFKDVWTGNNEDGWREERSYEDVNMQLTLNTNNTVDFKVTGNEKYNITTTGKWYNIAGRLKHAQGILVTLNDKTFFDGYFTLGNYNENINVGATLDDLKYYASSIINIDANIRYEIGWTAEAEKELFHYYDESYIGKTYAYVTGQTIDGKWVEETRSAYKLQADGTVNFIHNEELYVGTWQENGENKLKLNLKHATNSEEYILDVEIGNIGSSVRNAESSPKELVDEGISGYNMSKYYYRDISIDNGLYVSVNSETSTEPGTYIRKLSDSEIYVKDNAMGVSKLEIVDHLGNCLIVKYNQDRAGEDYILYLLGVEYKGEHSEDFIEEYGDLDYVIYSIDEEFNNNYRYYYRKATASDITLQVTEKTTFNAIKLFKHTYGFDNVLGSYVNDYSYEDVNMQLTINTNNTVKLVITGNEKYNVTTTGKWYNIGCGKEQGLLIILEDKSFFNGYFALGVNDDDNITLEHLLTDDAYSCIDVDENTIYEIGWISETEEALKTEYDARNA